MRRAQSLGMLLGLFLVCHVWGQSSPGLARRLTNQDIISMVELGLSEDVVIAKIRSMSAMGPDTISFDTSVEGMKALKSANVHLGSKRQVFNILRDLRRRKSNWLRSAGSEMAKAMEGDWKKYRDS